MSTLSKFRMVFLFLVSQFLFIHTAYSQATSTFIDLEVEAFSTALSEKEGAVLLDVRTPAEWQTGYIDGALLMDFHDPGFEEKLSTLDKQKPVFVYCKAGGRSGKTAEQLYKMGFLEVYNLLGGMTAWEEEKGKETLVKP